MSEFTLKQKLFWFFPVLFCFAMPFGSLFLSGVVVVWTIVSFLNVERRQFLLGLKNRNLQLSWLFFFLTLLSAALSENFVTAVFNVEVAMTFILFPYFFFCFRWPPEILKRCVVGFVSGCFFACLFLLARAVFYSAQGNDEYFFYNSFSWFIHVAYFSMYLILAIAFVLVLYPAWFRGQRQIFISGYVFTCVFIATVFLCSSKLGVATLFLCVPVILLYRWRQALKLRTLLLLPVALVVILFVAPTVFPGTFERLRSVKDFNPDTIDQSSSESTAVRVLIWREATGLIKENFLVGAGVGDVNDLLYNAYNTRGMSGALKHHLNAHNQFLQTFVGMGIVGMIALIALTVGQLIKAIATRHFFLFMFSLLITLNFLVESMLQASAGVLFFNFFYCFFNLTGEKDLRLA